MGLGAGDLWGVRDPGGGVFFLKGLISALHVQKVVPGARVAGPLRLAGLQEHWAWLVRRVLVLSKTAVGVLMLRSFKAGMWCAPGQAETFGRLADRLRGSDRGQAGPDRWRAVQLWALVQLLLLKVG